MRVAVLIAANDLRQRLRDRSAVLIAVVAPLALAAIFALILSDVADGTVTFDYAIVDQDGGIAAELFSSTVLGEFETSGLIELTRADSLEEGERLAKDGHVAATFLIPAGFSDAVVGGRPGRLVVLGNVDLPIAVAVARSIAETYTSEVSAIQLAVATAATAADVSLEPEVVAELGVRAAAAGAPVRVEDTSTISRQLEPTTFFSAGMAVFFLLFVVQFGVSSLLDERRDGTLQRLLVAPVAKTSILTGKFLSSVVLGTVSMAVLAVATSLLLGAHWGNPVGVGLLIIAAVLAATAITALIATLAQDTEQARGMQAIAAVVLGLVGGSFFSIAQAGGLIGTISLLTPHAWFLRGLGDLAGGGDLASVLVPAAVLLGFAAVVGGFAMWRLDRVITP